MDATDRYKLLLKLNPSQALAVEVLDRGGTHAEAAEAAAVDRTTVARWVRRHPAFIAEVNRRRLDRARSNEHALGEIDRKALATLREAMESGGPDLALRWLKLRGLTVVASGPAGPTDPLAVIEARQNALSNEMFSNLALSSGQTVGKAVSAIWADLEGPEIVDTFETYECNWDDVGDWEEELGSMEPEDLLLFSAEELENLVAKAGTDPTGARHLRRLGLVDDSSGDPVEPEPSQEAAHEGESRG